MLRTTIGLSLISGRLVGLAAALTFGLMVWWGQDLLRYALFHVGPTWGEVGIVPLVIVLRIFVAAWVVRGVVKLHEHDLLPALLTAFGISFFILFGWYFLILGYDDAFFYWAVGGDFLYLVAELLLGCSLMLVKIAGRPGNATT